MKQDWTVYIYKLDRRCKLGRRRVSTTVWCSRDQEGIEREVREIRLEYPESKGFCIEFVPTMRTVKNLMTGEEVQIPYDTPRSCDPSTELYWSM